MSGVINIDFCNAAVHDSWSKRMHRAGIVSFSAEIAEYNGAFMS